MTNDAILQELHDATAQQLLSIIKDGIKGEDGKTYPAPAAYLNVARQLLKDNDFRADPKKNPALKSLSEEVPFPTEDDPEGIYVN